MKRISIALALFAALGLNSGCSLISAVKTKIKLRHAASDAWYRFYERHECLEHPDDIEDGFKDGYKAFVLTSCPGPCPKLPCKYYRPWYQTCFGRREIDAWREGWEFGQYIASQDCFGRGHCGSCGSFGGCAAGCSAGGCPGGPGLPGMPGAGPGCACGAPGYGPMAGFPGSTPIMQAGAEWQPMPGPGPGVAQWNPTPAGEMIPADHPYAYAGEEYLHPPEQFESVLPSPPAPAIPTETAPAPAPADAPSAAPAQPMPMPRGTSAPSARLQLPAPTAAELSPADAAKDPPQIEVPVRNTSSPGPAQFGVPVYSPATGGRGPQLMTPADAAQAEYPAGAAAPGGYAPQGLGAPQSIPPATIEQPVLHPQEGAPSGAAATGPAAGFGAEVPGHVSVPSNPFAGAAADANTTGEALPANRGWKPLDWKPTKSAAAPR